MNYLYNMFVCGCVLAFFSLHLFLFFSIHLRSIPLRVLHVHRGHRPPSVHPIPHRRSKSRKITFIFYLVYFFLFIVNTQFHNTLRKIKNTQHTIATTPPHEFPNWIQSHFLSLIF